MPHTVSGMLVGAARVAKTVTGIGTVYGKASTTHGIQPVPARLDAATFPACFVLWRGFDTTPGSHQRQVHRIQYRLFFPHVVAGQAYDDIMEFPERLLVANEAHPKAYLTCESFLLTGTEDLVDQRWGSTSDDEATPRYLVLPVNFEAVIYRATNYNLNEGP